jgi:hypothetical protein
MGGHPANRQKQMASKYGYPRAELQ